MFSPYRQDSQESRLVYSTNPKAQEKPLAPQKEFPPPSEQKIKIWLDRKGRKGKTMTIVEGVEASENDLERWLKELKKICGAGGTLTADGLQIQGEQAQKVQEYFTKLGFQCKTKN